MFLLFFYGETVQAKNSSVDTGFTTRCYNEIL